MNTKSLKQQKHPTNQGSPAQSVGPDAETQEAMAAANKDRPVIVFTFGKGGVGKTATAQAALIALREAGHQVVGIDADGSNSSLKRQVADAVLLDVNDPTEVITNLERSLIELAFQQGHSVVVDTGGGIDKAIRQWFSTEDVMSICQAHNIDVIALSVIDSSMDSAAHVMETVDAMPAAHHALVMNLGHTPGSIGEKAFQPLFSDPEFSSYAARLPHIVMPRLADAVELDALGARLHTIGDRNSPAAANPFLVSRTKSWLSTVTGALKPVLTGA